VTQKSLLAEWSMGPKRETERQRAETAETERAKTESRDSTEREQEKETVT
jgi:hypothetical protein